MRNANAEKYRPGKTVWLAICFALGAGVACQAARLVAGQSPVAPHGETKVSALLGGVKVSADLLSHQVAIGSASDQPPQRPMTNCTYSHVPCMLIDSLELSVGDHEVYVPRSVFADLSDVWSATLEQVAPGRFGLILVGGDSSAAYEAEIRFDSRRVTTRILTDREAGQVSEKTVYFDMSKAFH